MRSSWRNGLLFLSQRSLGRGLPPAAQRNLTVLAAGTACSFFSIFADEVQYGAPATREQLALRIPNRVLLSINSLASGASDRPKADIHGSVTAKEPNLNKLPRSPSSTLPPSLTRRLPNTTQSSTLTQLNKNTHFPCRLSGVLQRGGKNSSSEGRMCLGVAKRVTRPSHSISSHST